MKKKVKSLIIAASVAAVAGIGAVSFAAWTNSSTVPTGTGNVNTGEITLTAGFIQDASETEKTLTFDAGKKLVPVDQTTLGANDAKILAAQLPAYQVGAGNYTFELTLGASQSYKIYYQVADEAPTVDSVTGDTDAEVIASLGSSWIAAGAKQTVTNTDAATIDANATSLYIVLVSSDAADMNKTIDITLKLEQTA